MTKRDTGFLKGLSVTSQKMTERDRTVSERRAMERGELSAVPLESIKLRTVDTRPLKKAHVWKLVESIAVLGLIEPLVIDEDKVLLAGGHRLAAITLLSEEPKYIEAYERHFTDGKVPVRIMPLVAVAEPELALQIEVAENEHRRDYTPAEVRSLADRLLEAGYKNVKGRPKKNEKPLMPVLSVVVGKNIRTIQRYLGDGSKKSATSVVLYLKKAKKSLETWQEKISVDTVDSELSERLPEILELLSRELEKADNR